MTLLWVVDARKIAFGSVPNLGNYGHFFIHFACMLWYFREEWLDVHIWHSNWVPCVANAYKIASGAVPNLSNYGIFFINIVCLVQYLRKEGLILFIHKTKGNTHKSRNLLYLVLYIQVWVCCQTRPGDCGTCVSIVLMMWQSSQRQWPTFSVMQGPWGAIHGWAIKI